VKYNPKFLFTPFIKQLTYRSDACQIFMLDGSNDADSHKGVPFWGFVGIAAHLGGEIAPKPHLWRRE